MDIYEVENRTPELLDQLVVVWEGSVRATHLFLSNEEVLAIKEYVPQALGGVEHLLLQKIIKAFLLASWELKIKSLKCCLLMQASAARALANSC